MGLYLSKRHGVNPSLDQCFFCGKDKGLILFGQLRAKQAEALREAGLISDDGLDPTAPRRICLDSVPCAECAEHMQNGIILISVDPTKSSDHKNPYRSGGWIVVTEDYIRRIGPNVFPGIYESILERRVAFVEDEVWDLLQWPRGEQTDAGASP